MDFKSTDPLVSLYHCPSASAVSIFRKNINDICFYAYVIKPFELFKKCLRCCKPARTVTRIIGSEECYASSLKIAFIFERTTGCSPQVAWNVYPVLFFTTAV